MQISTKSGNLVLPSGRSLAPAPPSPTQCESVILIEDGHIDRIVLAAWCLVQRIISLVMLF